MKRSESLIAWQAAKMSGRGSYEIGTTNTPMFHDSSKLRATALRCLVEAEAAFRILGGGTLGHPLVQSLIRSGVFYPPPELVTPLAAALKGGLVPPNAVVLIGRTAGVVQPEMVASAMLERLADGEPASHIVDSLISLFEDPFGETIRVLALGGVSVAERVVLENGVEIVPPDQIPASRNREVTFGIDRWGNVDSEALMRSTRMLPRGALIIKTRRQFISIDFPDHDMLQLNTEQEVEQCAIAAITLSGEICPIPISSYDVNNHPAFGPSSFGLSGSSSYGGQGESPPKLLNHSAISQIYACIRNLSPKIRESLLLSCSRLQRSRGHPNFTDRAIDLGIAIESTLMHGEEGPGAKGEMRNKIGLRGAWLIGKNLEERRQVYKDLTRAYDARSSAVHSGKLGTEYIEILPMADAHCRTILLNITEKGSYPNWAELTLGG